MDSYDLCRKKGVEKLKPKFELEILEDFRQFFKKLSFSVEIMNI